MNTSTKNLMFLLGAAPMSLSGCLGDEIGDTVATLTSTTLSTSFSTTDQETTGDGDGDGAPGDGDGAPGDGDGTPGDGDGTPGDGDGTPGDGDGTPGDGDGAPGDGDGAPGTITETCVAYSEQIGLCFDPNYIEDAYMYCMSYYQMYADMSPACGAAYEAFLVCLSSITCDDLMMDPPTGCEQAISDVQSACP